MAQGQEGAASYCSSLGAAGSGGLPQVPDNAPPIESMPQFMEIWLTDNNAEIELTDSLKSSCAELLKIHKDDFWTVMRNYAARSKDGLAPDLEDIANSMREHEDLHFLSVDEIVGKWWSLIGDYYVPNLHNFDCFIPASGVLHRFYDVVVNPNALESKMAAVMESRPGKLYRTDPLDLPKACSMANPFRPQPFPVALYIEPVPSAPAAVGPVRGTYGLSKTVVNNKLFVRPKRTVNLSTSDAAAGEVLLHVGLSSVIALPMSCQGDYADDKNGVMMTVKDKKSGKRGSRNQEPTTEQDGSEANRNIKLKVRLPPQSGVTEVTIPDLDCDVYSFPDFRVYPVRSLAPSPAISMHLDYGALWDGCCAPLTKTSMPLDDVCNLLGDFPREAFNFFFEPAITGGMVYADDYVRFATWFKSIGGFGQEYKNVVALYHSLKSDNLTLSLKSGANNNSELVRATNQVMGSYLLRFSRSHPASLTMEVLQDVTSNEPLPVTINSYRVAVHLEPAAPSIWGACATTEPTIRFSLIDADLSLHCQGTSIATDLVPQLEHALGGHMTLKPFQPQYLVRKADYSLDTRPTKIPAFTPSIFPPFKNIFPFPSSSSTSSSSSSVPAASMAAAGAIMEPPPALPYHHTVASSSEQAQPPPPTQPVQSQESDRQQPQEVQQPLPVQQPQPDPKPSESLQPKPDQQPPLPPPAPSNCLVDPTCLSFVDDVDDGSSLDHLCIPMDLVANDHHLLLVEDGQASASSSVNNHHDDDSAADFFLE